MPFNPFNKSGKAVKARPAVWIVVLLATFAQAGDGVVTQGIPVLYPFIQKELSLTRAELGLITSAMMAGSMMTVLIGGWLADVWGVRRMLVLALIYTSVPVFAFAFINSLWMAIGIAILIGIGTGPIYPASSRAIMDWLPKNIRGLGMSVKQAAPSLAGTAGALVLPVIAIQINLSTAIVVLSLIPLLMGIVFFIFYKEPPTKLGSTRSSLFIGFGDLTRDPRLMMVTTWGFIIVGLQFSVLSYLILFLVEDAGYSEVKAAGYLGMALMASVIARVLWGGVSDFILGTRRVATLCILGIVGVLGLFSAAIIGTATTDIVIAIVCITIGISILSWPGIFTVYIAELGGAERSGAAIGTVNTVQRLGIVIVPPLFGLLVDNTNSYSLAWGLAGAMLLIGTIILFIAGKEPLKEK